MSYGSSCSYVSIECLSQLHILLNITLNEIKNYYLKRSFANINEEVLTKLGAGISKLSENAAQMAEISNAMAATNDYAKAMKKATETVGALEVQLQSSMIVAETNNKLNKTMSEYIEKVNASATSTEALNHQISDLSKRMTALNTVYGNMLSAMNVKA